MDGQLIYLFAIIVAYHVIAMNDVVFIDSLQLSANIGPDCWGRSRAQPVLVSIHLHLSDGYLTYAGQTDDVKDSVHYGHLCKAISKRLEDPSARFSDVRDLIAAVTEEGFQLGGEVVVEVKVKVELSKMILLAAGFSVEVTTARKIKREDVGMKVSVTGVILAVIIGVNPPERKAKQRVITDIILLERAGSPWVDYERIVAKIFEVSIFHDILYLHIFSSYKQNIENSSYLTLEKFVLEVARTCCLSSDFTESVTVRAQKPSALTFARTSGVEITRNPSHFR